MHEEAHQSGIEEIVCVACLVSLQVKRQMLHTKYVMDVCNALRIACPVEHKSLADRGSKEEEFDAKSYCDGGLAI